MTSFCLQRLQWVGRVGITDGFLVGIISKLDRTEAKHSYQVDSAPTYCTRFPGYTFCPRIQLYLHLWILRVFLSLMCDWPCIIYLSVRFLNGCRRLPETKRHYSLFLYWSGSKLLAVMAACTPSIHVFLGRPLFLLSRGIQSIINSGILSSGILYRASSIYIK